MRIETDIEPRLPEGFRPPRVFSILKSDFVWSVKTLFAHPAGPTGANFVPRTGLVDHPRNGRVGAQRGWGGRTQIF